MPRRIRAARRIFAVFLFAALISLVVVVLASWPRLNWSDRRPVGTLFLASYAHRSDTNPRGWFNAPGFNIDGPEGAERFRRMLMNYAARSTAILKAAGAQGMIVWDLEGEQYPQKISYIGDPRQLPRLAPEMNLAADAFFAVFRAAGLRVGVTVRPQRLVFNPGGPPRQQDVWREDQTLLQKIDYARTRWGATLFYLDSTRGWLSPAELFSLSAVARRRPDVLLIPEHNLPMFYAFSAPYAALRRGEPRLPAPVRFLYPNAFRALDISDRPERLREIAAASRAGDILLFPAWFHGKESEAVNAVTTSPR